MLLEREDLLHGLAEALTSAADGTGALVLVAGEAGAGKTSLVEAFTKSLGDRELVIRGACDPLTTPRPFGPLLDFASDPDAGLADLADDRGSFDLFGEVLDRLRTSIRPIVMVIEDVHWADEGTLDFLRFVGRRVGDTRAMVICTYRDDEIGFDHRLRTVLGQLTPLGTTHRLVVPPLSLAAVATLASDVDIEPTDLLQRTGGNPFYVTEIVATGGALPSTVQDAVLARVGQADPASRRVIEAVAIAPRALDVEHATALAGATDTDIDRALATGVLLGDGRTLRFRHELARSAVAEALPPARRLRLHRRMLKLLEEDDSTDLAMMAHHALAAGAEELVTTYAPLAARQASARGAHREAISFYRGLLDLVDDLDPRLEAEIRSELGVELGIVDRPDEALREMSLVVDLLRHRGSTARLGLALATLSRALWRMSRLDEAADCGAEALALLEPLGPSIELAKAHYSAAYRHMLGRRAHEAIEHIAHAQRLAAKFEDPDLAWSAKMMAGTIQTVVGDASAGLRMLAECVDEARAAEDVRKYSIALGMLGSGGGEVRRYDEAITALEDGVTRGLATDEDYGVAYSRAWLARVAFEQGKWDDAVEYAELVHRTSHSREGIAILTASSALARVRVRRGDPGARALLDEMTTLALTHELQHGWNAACGLAEFHWLGGRQAEGLAAVEHAFRAAMETDSEWARGETGYWMWRCGGIEQPPEGAAEPFAREMAGDWRGAAGMWRSIGCPYEVALALTGGDVAALGEALEIFDGLGARPMADRVRSMLREAGATRIPRRPSRTTRHNPFGLTNRQLEVLRLMVRGLGNAEIAEQLYVTKKTVEHHVSAVFTKLGVDSRAKAISMAHGELAERPSGR